jgi:DNA-binding NarL/FixJ family response regulator
MRWWAAVVSTINKGQLQRGNMSDVQELVLPPGLRAGVGALRPDGPVLTVHNGGWEADHPSATHDDLVSPVRVYIYAKDAVLRAGVASQLRRIASIQLASEYRPDRAAVAMVVADELGEDVDAAIRAVRRSCTPRIIVVTNQLVRSGVEAAVAAGAWLFLRRCDARPDRLVDAIRLLAATAEPPASADAALGELAAEVLDDAVAEPPRAYGLTERDMEVLRLIREHDQEHHPCHREGARGAQPGARRGGGAAQPDDLRGDPDSWVGGD